MMKTVVFGGSGFLGSHIADRLTECGHDVTVFDRAPSPYVRPNQTMVLGDILNEEAVQQAVAGASCVYHFAGLSDIEEANRKPLETVRLNILGTTVLLDACRKVGVKRFMYASTVYVYSQLGGFYRCSKQAAELYIETFQREYGLPYTVLRYGSLYGPRADASNAVHRYLTEALRAGKIECRGDGEEVREYIHVEDAAHKSVDALAPEFENQYVILTGHQPMKVRDLLAMIEEILNTKLDITFQAPQASVHYRRTPYAFHPQLGKTLVSRYYLDMGQGLLACLNEIYEREAVRR